MVETMRKTIAFVLILILTIAFAPTTGLLCSHVNADAKAASESTAEHTILLKGKGQSKSIKYSWNEVPDASKYKLYIAKSGKKYSLVKTTKSLSYTRKKLSPKYIYRAYVAAMDSRGMSIARSPAVFLYTKSAKRSNAVIVSAQTELNIDQGSSTYVSARVTKKSSGKPLLKVSSIGKQIRYYSDDENTVTVDTAGKVTGVSPGTANVYAMALSGAKAKTTVTVNETAEEIPLEKITMANAITLKAGESQTLSPAFVPENATDKALVWESSRSSVAAVTDQGTVTAVTEGTAVVTAKSANSDIKANCNVTVVKADRDEESAGGGGYGGGGDNGDESGTSSGSEEEGGTSGDSGSEEDNIDTIDWMKNLPDSAPLSEVNLPGTHNTCCRYFYTGGKVLLRVTSPYAKTQGLSVPEQFNAGVRFTDIRAAVVNEDDETLTVPHNMCITADKKDEGDPMTVDRVIGYAEEFVETHPTETIILGIEDDVRYYNDYTEKLEELKQKVVSRFKTESDKIYLEPGYDLPKVGEARGKVILIFNDDIQKIPTGNSLPGDVLWNLQIPYYESVQDQDYANYQAFTNGNGTASRPYVWKTHATGIVDEDGSTIGLGIPDPKENSDAYYTGFMNYNLTKGKFYGWFAMDYVTEEICTKIIKTNIFSHQTCNMR